MKSTWVLIPVHNRRDTTLQCLDHLKHTQSWDQFEVVVIDDGSTDGTSEAIENKFPEVTVLDGDGSLWWGGSIRIGMEYAMNHDAEVIMWLNDDVLPDSGAIKSLSNKTAELGDTVLTTRVETNPESEYTTCHKKTRVGIKSIPYNTDSKIQYCDVAAGKFTAFPRNIVKKIGYPNNKMFPHNLCDYDYTLRAKEHGFNVGVYTDVSARDVGQDLKRDRLSSDVSFVDLIKQYFDPKEETHYNIRTRYYRYKRFYGPPIILSIFGFIYYLITIIIVLAAKVITTFIK